MVNTFTIGQHVQLTPAFAEGDSQVFVVREWNGDRGIISPANWPYGDILPTELVTDVMIRPVTSWTDRIGRGDY